MAFLARELIKKKRDGGELNKAEIDWLISSYVKDEIPDYQMAAWLMAVYQQDMTTTEASLLTEAMKVSGEVIDLSFIEKPKVDKHSTGGVGDKTSMILGPIVAANDVCVPMMAGRGLGHTGGTLDKLEAIPGFLTQLSVEKFKQQLREIDFSIIGQTKEIVPADKKLYALRDVTATIESIPLICASIMSKKLAEGIDALVLDVKHGAGAFMKTKERAKDLAQALQRIGYASGKEVSAVISDMNQVLGRMVGNANEIQECVEILTDTSTHSKYADTVELSLALSAHMLLLAKRATSYEDAYALAVDSLSSGRAYEKFEEMVRAQGGDLKKLPKVYDAVDFNVDFSVEEGGYVASIDAEKIGVAGILIGAGRKKAEDLIDPRAGFEVMVKVGDRLEKGQCLVKVFAKDRDQARATFDLLRNAFAFSPDQTKTRPLIAETLVGIRG